MTLDLAHALDFSGKQVLITGGSDGIGYGIAQAFKQAGAVVAITGTRPANTYRQDFNGVRYFELNVRDPESIEHLALQFDRVDVLVNAVGTVLYGSQEFTRRGFEQVVEVNLTGIMHLCTAFKEKLAVTRGCIVNLDSAVAYRVARNNPAYTASKAALQHLNKVLAWKWGRLGIRVNGIGPGAVPTKLTADQLTEVAQRTVGDRLPLGRCGTPEDMAGPVLFLASPLASYVTGVSILVDGGLTVLSDL